MSTSEEMMSSYSQHIVDEDKQKTLQNLLGEAPECFRWMQADIVDFVVGEEITVSFPVLEGYLNPGLTMQGGVISAAIDNAFGPLCVMAAGSIKGVMVDMNTSYHRPIFTGDVLTVHARVKYKGRRKVYMLAEAANGAGKLVATSAATYLVLE